MIVKQYFNFSETKINRVYWVQISKPCCLCFRCRQIRLNLYYNFNFRIGWIFWSKMNKILTAILKNINLIKLSYCCRLVMNFILELKISSKLLKRLTSFLTKKISNVIYTFSCWPNLYNLPSNNRYLKCMKRGLITSKVKNTV